MSQFTISFDYRFDTNGFFSDPQRKATLESAAQIWASLIQDDFPDIPAGLNFTVTNPQTGIEEQVQVNQPIDDLIIFVGARTGVGGDILAEGGFGGGDAAGTVFSHRLKASNFEPWAGTIAFDSLTNWFFDTTPQTDTDIPNSSVDFLTVALHEIGHVLGISTASIFRQTVANRSFRGFNAKAVNQGQSIPLTQSNFHVRNGFVLADNQEVLLDPTIDSPRKRPTLLDLALLADIGYQFAPFNGFTFTTQGASLPSATEGNDTIFGTIFDDLIDGLGGNDRIQGDLGNDTLSGGLGKDTLLGQAGNDVLDGGDGDDRLFGGEGNPQGTQVGDDQIFGGAGQDSLVGEGGEDFLSGGEGNDTVQGGIGNDTLQGGAGKDTLQGGLDNDFLEGEGEVDLLLGEEGEDNLSGGEGNDQLQGGTGNDFLGGDGGDDVLFGQEEEDKLSGGEGNDQLQGGTGNDQLQGGTGNDTLFGQDGNDILSGGTGNDVLIGGLGNDIYFIEVGNGQDQIGTDSDLFDIANEKIYIASGLGLTPEQVFNTFIRPRSFANATKFNLGSGNTLEVIHSSNTNPQVTPLTSANFVIVDSNFLEPGTIAFNAASYSLNENGTATTAITLNRSNGSNGAISVKVNLTDGTATAPSDYNNAPITVTFAPGETSKTFTVPIINDSLFEATETINLILSNPTGGATLGTQKTAILSIIDNDLPAITFLATDIRAAETEQGQIPNPGVFTLTRTGPTTSALTVNYSLTGTAINGTDYNNLTGIAIFRVGSSTAQVRITPRNDSLYEGNETAILRLAPGVGYTIGTPRTATVTLVDNDSLPVVNLSANQRVIEGLTSPQSIAYTVTLSNASSQTITINYATSDGTALTGSDYIQQTGTLTFNPGITSQVITLSIFNDSLNEADETFDLILSNPTFATLGAKINAVTTLTDTLNASETTILPIRIENLTLIGNTALDGIGNNFSNVIKGNSGNNVLTGNAGSDTLNGGAGIDTLIGGRGNDFYQVDSTTDSITELAVEGIDTVQSSVTFSLTALANIENLTLTGTTATNAIGNSLNNTLTGNIIANILNGGVGNDTLMSRNGNDTLLGGVGNDILIGGVGNDSLTGGRGGDRFTFTSRTEGLDQITDFVSLEGDKLVISAAGFGEGLLAGVALTNAQFVLGSAAIDASDRFIYNQTSGNLFFDRDGTGSLAAIQIVMLSSKPILTFTDFVVIA